MRPHLSNCWKKPPPLTKTCGDKASSLCTPKLWNSLPFDLRKSHLWLVLRKDWKHIIWANTWRVCQCFWNTISILVMHLISILMKFIINYYDAWKKVNKFLFVPVRYKIDKVQNKKYNLITDREVAEAIFLFTLFDFFLQFLWTVRPRKQYSATSSFLQVNGGVDGVLRSWIPS